MFKLYYASAIDVCQKKAFKQIEEFKKIFSKYDIQVYGAGFGNSPIIPLGCSEVYKAVITAYDMRQIRKCDILLVVTDLKTFAAGTFEEMMYARTNGLYVILLVLNKRKGYKPIHSEIKNIFLESHADKIIYSIDELEQVLRQVTLKECK